jgi:hypothetical protein
MGEKRLYNCAKCRKFGKKGLTRGEVFESSKKLIGCRMIGSNLLCKYCKKKEELVEKIRNKKE